MLTSFLPSNEALFSPKDRKMLFSKNRKSKKEAYAAWQHVITREVECKNWRVLGHMVKVSVHEGVPYSKLMEIAKGCGCIPLQKAIVASEKMIHLSKKMGITQSDCLQLALYVEAELDTELKQFGPYRSLARTGLTNTVVVDPETKNTFIYLKNSNDIRALGYQRCQTQAILYNNRKPKLVAKFETDQNIDDEIAHLFELQGNDGICEAMYVTKHKKEEKTYTQVLSALYPYGTLLECMQRKGKRLSLQERIVLAVDIAKGLEVLHNKGYVHRNLGMHSFVVRKVKQPDSKRMRYQAACADLAKMLPSKQAKGHTTQANSFYRPPEGIVFESLDGQDFFAADLFALGTVFQHILTAKPAPWVDMAVLKDTKTPKDVLYETYKEKITKYRKKRFRTLVMKNWDRNNPPVSESFERLILKMIDPNPHKRGTVEEARQMLEQLLERVKVKKQKKKRASEKKNSLSK